MIDSPAKIVDGRPVSGSARGEDVTTVFASSDIATYLLAQGVIVVVRVADGQQVTVLGIEDEQETVEENQGGFAHFLQRRLGRYGSDGSGKLRKDLSEDQSERLAATRSS